MAEALAFVLYWGIHPALFLSVLVHPSLDGAGSSLCYVFLFEQAHQVRVLNPPLRVPQKPEPPNALTSLGHIRVWALLPYIHDETPDLRGWYYQSRWAWEL